MIMTELIFVDPGMEVNG